MSRSPSRVSEIDTELRALYARYEHLMRERTYLTHPPTPTAGPAAAGPAATCGPGVLAGSGGGGGSPTAGPAATGGPGVLAGSGGGGGVVAPYAPFAPGAGGRDASPVSVQAVLLTLGGVLLGVASIVFTLVAWSRLGVGGRAAVLGGVTAVALAAPVALLRRRLAATGETVAGLGLLLVLLDAYLLRRLDLAGLGGPSAAAYTGAVLGLVAAGYFSYGLALPSLRGVRPTALVLAQPALPLLVGRGGPLWVAGALLLVAGLDLLARPRTVATVCGGLAWASAVLVLLPPAYASPVGVTAVLLLMAAGALAVAGAGALGGAREVSVAAGVLVAAAGVIAPLRAALAPFDGGPVLATTIVALAVATVAALSSRPLGTAPSPRTPADNPAQPGAGPAAGVLGVAVRLLGVRVAAGVLLVPGVLAALAAAVVASAVPGATAVTPWHGVADPALPGLPRLLLPTGVLAAAGVALLLRTWLPVLLTATGVLALTAPVVLHLPYPVTLAVLAATTLACWRVPVAAAPLAGLTLAWSLATEPATIAVLAGLALAAAAQAGTAPGRRTRAVAAAVTVGALAAESAAVPLAAGGTRTVIGFALLGVAAAAAVAAALTRRRAPAESFAAEVTGAATALAGVTAAATGTLAASAAFTVLAGILAAAALRPDRRMLVWPAAAAVQLAVWITLGGSDVAAPEAYTGPLTVALLALGAYRRRADRTLSSWTAYGPGLAITALPSLGAAVDGGDVRPLLLGAAALATLLVGARARLQAPLALGAATLALLAIDQLGPAFAQLTAELPRWLAPALAGAVLLVLGSTYERRLAQVRRASAAFSRLA